MADPLVRVYEQGADESDEDFAKRVAFAYVEAVKTTPSSYGPDDESDMEAY